MPDTEHFSARSGALSSTSSRRPIVRKGMSDTSVRSIPVNVPFVELRLQDRRLERQILDDIAELVGSAAFVNGPQVKEFELAFATYCGVLHCVGVSSGLDALRLGLMAAGLEPGDEVVMPAATFVATVEAVSQAHGVPVLADISEHDYCLDIAAAAAAVGESTRALLPVHLYGQLADIEGLEGLSKRHGLVVLEDACQAHGAERDGQRAGSSGLAAFSFYPAKNLGAFGDAGALVTSSPELAECARGLREHGQRRKYEHEREGYTARLDTIQALVLLRKLPYLDAWNEERRQAAAFYRDALEGVGDLRLPPVPAGSQPAWHLFVVQTADPSSLAVHLSECGIHTGRHYPQPIHLTEAYANLGYVRGAFPVAERLARSCLSLPIFPGVAEYQLEHVVREVRRYFDGG
jgi:dTDP-4-amino-4,6-dideoxygalactose transaminase